MLNEDFDYKAKEKYTLFEERASNIDLQSLNKDIKAINIDNITNTNLPSIQIDYKQNTKPSLVEVAIQSREGDLYYWDYIIESDEFLNFILPDQVLKNSGLYYVQVNVVWKNKNNILCIQKYNFNISL